MCHPRRAPQYTDDFIFWHRVELGLDRFLSSILASTALDTLWSSGVEWGFGFSAHVTFRDLVFVKGFQNVVQVAFVKDGTPIRRVRPFESTTLNQTHANKQQKLKNSVDPCT